MPNEHPEIAVRCAEPGDAEGVDELLRFLDAVHAEARPDLFRLPAGSPRGEDFLSGLLRDPLQEMLVAVQERQVVGYVHARVSHSAASSSRVERRFGEIESLAVLPRVQRLGLGRKLIEGAWEWLSSQGLDDCQIAVHAFNAEATRLYRRMGFAPSVTLLRRKG